MASGGNGMRLAPQIDRQALAPRAVQTERRDGPLDNRRGAHRGKRTCIHGELAKIG
jgi:hypothetical protein